MAETTRPLVVGVGNRHRGDDAIGPLVVEGLASLPHLPADTELISGDCTHLVDRLAERDLLIVVDACQSGARPGTLYRFDTADGPVPAFAGGVSTHGFGVADALSLAASLGSRSGRCVVLAVEGSDFDMGAPLSAALDSVRQRIIQAILDELTDQSVARSHDQE